MMVYVFCAISGGSLYSLPPYPVIDHVMVRPTTLNPIISSDCDACWCLIVSIQLLKETEQFLNLDVEELKSLFVTLHSISHFAMAAVMSCISHSSLRYLFLPAVGITLV